jgi:mRNA-degrading endonuclease RelE of RelBE toxin-antitoxin system
MTSDEWTWEFDARAKRAFETLEQNDRKRIVSKLDDIVTDEWREPPEYVEPLTGTPHGKIRVGDFRLGANAERKTATLVVFTIEHRSDAYKPGDD